MYHRVACAAACPAGGIPQGWRFLDLQVYGDYRPDTGEWRNASAEYGRCDQSTGVRRLHRRWPQHRRGIDRPPASPFGSLHRTAHPDQGRLGHPLPTRPRSPPSVGLLTVPEERRGATRAVACPAADIQLRKPPTPRSPDGAPGCQSSVTPLSRAVEGLRQQGYLVSRRLHVESRFRHARGSI